MSNEQNVKQELEKKLAKLRQEKRQALEEDPYSDTDRVNDNAAIDTEAAEEEGHLRSEALMKSLDESIEKVTQALKNFENGQWGRCQNCGNKIEPRRLELDVATLVCRNCAEKSDE